jgi:cytochrome c oxidase subunit 2
MTARRFVYEPNEIALKAGERVVVAIRSLDFVHGMNIPDLGMRLDLMPGRVTRLELQPKAPGVIDFVCDNFCGDGHEEMHGRFVVSA